MNQRIFDDTLNKKIENRKLKFKRGTPTSTHGGWGRQRTVATDIGTSIRPEKHKKNHGKSAGVQEAGVNYYWKILR